MKKLMKLFTVIFTILVSAFFYQGCSELDDNIVTHDASNQCTICHGQGDHPNPPKALNGAVVNTDPRVGAHVTHLDGKLFSTGIVCSECHIPVTSYWDSTHIGPSPDYRAEITFGPLAKKIIFGGYVPDPQYDGNTSTCSDVYCHGGFAGGNQANVKWNEPATVVCGACHGNPTTGNPNPKPYANYTHDENNTINDCADCHPGVMNPDGTFKRIELHVNGVVNFSETP